MSTRRTGASAAGIGIGVLASLALSAAPSWAAGGMKLCVPRKEGAGLVTPTHGKCMRGYRLTSLGAEGKEGKAGKTGTEGKLGPEGKQGLEGKAGFTPEQAEQLKALLPYVRFVGTGVAGKPTVQFSGVNVEIVNGEGTTRSANGEGNLVIGYDEEPGEQTGSHNLVLGSGQTFTSYGGFVAGVDNRITERFASVSGGGGNLASGPYSSVSGGAFNKATEGRAWVGGGVANTASGFNSSVSGGGENHASGFNSSVSGGELNKATGEYSWVGGGGLNLAAPPFSSIYGGKETPGCTTEYCAQP